MTTKRGPATPAEPVETRVFTVICADETFGLPISAVKTIFRVGKIEPVPFAPRQIIGLVNLRGEIHPAASLRLILGAADGGDRTGSLAICVERAAERFALLVDDIGDVVSVSDRVRIAHPPHFNPRRAALTAGVFRLDNEILPVLDIDGLFTFPAPIEGAANERLHGGAAQ